MALKRLFGKSVELAKLPADLKALIEEMRKERNAFEALVIRSHGILKRAEDLGPTVAKAEPRLKALAEHLAALEAALPQATQVQSRLAEMAQREGEAQARLAETAEMAQRARADLEALGQTLSEAMRFRQELTDFLGLRDQFKELEAQVQDSTARFEQARTVQEDVHRQSAEATSRLAEFDIQWRKAMASVSQKLSELEGQRDAVDRATRGAERLADLVAKVDRQLQEQQINAKFLSMLDENVNQLKKMHEPLLEQAEQLKATLQAVTDQKDFLEKVVETAGTLAFQTMRAEAAINALREERAAGDKESQGKSSD